MRQPDLDSNFLHYLVESDIQIGESLPTLSEISNQLDVSVGKLREEISAARVMGIVSTKPRIGTKREPLDFSQAILPAIFYGLATGEATFEQLSQLRRGLETSLWEVAISQLQQEDLRNCQNIIEQARERLTKGRIPYKEHRAFHLTIFGRIDNPFAIGLLKAYWDIYDTSELTRYQPMSYWLDVWKYHERIINAIADDDVVGSRQLLIDHFNLLNTAPEGVNANDSTQ